MRKFFIVFCLAFFLSEAGLAQAVIQGTVEEQKTGTPIPGANIYLAGTTFGSSTDNNGHYKIKAPVSGPYDLVFSFVGFKKQVRQVELNSSSSLTINVDLEEKVQQLEEVEVRASNKKWQKQYEIFFDQFIGKNKYAKEVVIENPWVLNFKESKGYLTATSEKPFTVVNQALGYKLYVELVQFKWPKYRDRGGAYKLYPKYELLDPKNEEQQHRWIENRIKNYVGSFPHFTKSLYSNNLEESDFSIEQPWNLSSLPKGKTRYELMSMRGVSQNLINNAKGFELKGKIDVEFDGLVKYQLDGDTHSVSIEKRGGIIPNTRDQYFFVDEYGSLVNPFSIQVYRSWADNRVANSLPTNYSIGD